MRIPLVRGRYFTERDRMADLAEPVAIIDETMARRYFPGEDAVGKRVRTGGPNSTNPWLTIVGVVGHVKNYGVNAESRVELFLPHAQSPLPSSVLVVRAEGEPTSLVEPIRREVLAIDPDQPVSNVRQMEELLARSVTNERLSMQLLGLFAVVALVLAAVGIYGVMSYTVAQRTHEIGVRMALGAGANQVRRLVVRQGMALVGAGVVIGLVGAFLTSRLMASLLFEVSSSDPVTFVGGSVVLALVALLATFIPARRATRVDPMIALRYE